MTLFRNRFVLGVTSIILSVSAIYALLKLSAHTGSHSPFYLNLTVNVVSSLNIAILFAWIGLGIIPGIIISVFSLMFILFAEIRMGIYGYYPFVMLLAFISSVGYLCQRRKIAIEGSYILKMEKLEEGINILKNDIDEKKKSISSIEDKLNRYSNLKDVVGSLSTGLSKDEIGKLIIDAATRTLGGKGRILLFLVDFEKQELMLAMSNDLPATKTKKGDIYDQWVLRHRKSLIIEDISKDFRFSIDYAEASKNIFRSLIASPLVREDKVIGVLRMDHPDELAYAQDDLRLIDIIAGLGAVSMQNAMLYHRTQELALKDGLTGLFVRRYFMERFYEEVNRTARKKDALSVLILDIDHFKEYNDKYGHMAGDIVLKHLSRTVSSILQEGDIAARYGGEEIIVMLAGKAKSEAHKIAEGLRRAIQEKPIMLRRHETRITISAGISSYGDDSLLGDDLLRLADDRLYKAKNSGRDRVCSK